MRLIVILLTIFSITTVQSLPKGGKGGKGGAVKSGIKAVAKAVSSKGQGSSSTTSSYNSGLFFAPTETSTSGDDYYDKLLNKLQFGTPTTRRTTTTTRPISDQEYYEKIRRTYCHIGSKISLEEIESAVTCPGSGFTLQVFSALTNNSPEINRTSINGNITLENGPNGRVVSNASSIISSTTTPTEVSSTSTTTTTPISSSSTPAESSSNSTVTPILISPVIMEQNLTALSPLEKVHKICESFNSTCFEKMHTFVNECLSSEHTHNSPFGEAYQFDLYMAEEACVANKTTQIDEWTTGLEKCLGPYFSKQGETLKKAVSACKKSHAIPTMNLDSGARNISMTHGHGYNNKIFACVKDRIRAPSCTASCPWGTPGCSPLTTLTRNYYLESVVNLQIFLDRTSPSY